MHHYFEMESITNTMSRGGGGGGEERSSVDKHPIPWRFGTQRVFVLTILSSFPFHFPQSIPEDVLWWYSRMTRLGEVTNTYQTAIPNLIHHTMETWGQRLLKLLQWDIQGLPVLAPHTTQAVSCRSPTHLHVLGLLFMPRPTERKTAIAKHHISLHISCHRGNNSQHFLLFSPHYAPSTNDL